MGILGTRTNLLSRNLNILGIAHTNQSILVGLCGSPNANISNLLAEGDLEGSLTVAGSYSNGAVAIEVVHVDDYGTLTSSGDGNNLSLGVGNNVYNGSGSLIGLGSGSAGNLDGCQSILADFLAFLLSGSAYTPLFTLGILAVGDQVGYLVLTTSDLNIVVIEDDGTITGNGNEDTLAIVIPVDDGLVSYLGLGLRSLSGNGVGQSSGLADQLAFWPSPLTSAAVKS